LPADSGTILCLEENTKVVMTRNDSQKRRRIRGNSLYFPPLLKVSLTLSKLDADFTP